MIQFWDGFYADVRTEDRSRTTISYQAGILLEMKTRVERPCLSSGVRREALVLRRRDEPLCPSKNAGWTV